MGEKARQGTTVLAAALVLAYLGAVSISQVRDFAPWPANLAWLSFFSAMCGILLAISNDRAARSMVVASALAVPIFAGIWSYILWALLGEYISFFDLILSDFMFLYVIRLGALIFVVSTFFGLLGTVLALTIVPDRYRYRT